MKRPCGEDTEVKFDVDQQPALPQKLTLWQLYGLGVFSKPRSEGLLEPQRSGIWKWFDPDLLKVFGRQFVKVVSGVARLNGRAAGVGWA
jgi:hypothetical protein